MHILLTVVYTCTFLVVLIGRFFNAKTFHHGSEIYEIPLFDLRIKDLINEIPLQMYTLSMHVKKALKN